MLYVASPAPDGRSYVHDVATGSIVKQYKCDPAHSASSPSYSPTNKCIVVPQDKNAIFLYTLTMQQPIQRCFMPEKILATALSGDKQFLIGGGISGCLYVWSIQTGELMYITKGHLKDVNALSVSTTGTLVASASNDTLVKVWDLATLCRGGAQSITLFAAHTLGVTACQFFHLQDFVATSSNDRTCRVFDALSGGQLLSISLDHPGRSVSVLADDSMLIAGTNDGQVQFISLYEAEGPVNVKVAKFADGHQEPVTAIVCTDEGVVTASTDGGMILWNVSGDSPMLVRELSHVKAGICSMCIVPNVTMKGVELGDFNTSSDRCPVLSKYPVNTEMEKVSFHLPVKNVKLFPRSDVAALEEKPEGEAAQGDDASPSATAVPAETVVESAPAIKTSGAKYNKKKQKRLRAEADEADRQTKAKRLEDDRRREKALAEIAAVEAKNAELTKMAGKMAATVKKAKSGK